MIITSGHLFLVLYIVELPYGLAQDASDRIIILDNDSLNMSKSFFHEFFLSIKGSRFFIFSSAKTESKIANADFFFNVIQI